MSELVLMLVTVAGVPVERRARTAENLLSAVSRYTLSTLGPVSVSGAHFVAALILLHALPRGEFGLFSFLLVISPFCLSLCGAMFAPPIARRAAGSVRDADTEAHTLFKSSFVFAAGVAAVVGPLMWLSGAAPMAGISFGLYSALMSLRWFARCWAYGLSQRVRVLASDLTYSGIVCAILPALLAARHMNLSTVALALLGASVAALCVFGATQLRQFREGIREGQLKAFLGYWREMSGWAVLGVVLSEITINAHAYLVTFVSGPHAFAVLAIGSLLMRPVSLVLAALPDMERPLMSKALCARDTGRARQIVKEFRTAGVAIWIVTAAIGAVLLTCFPHLLIKRDYAVAEVTLALLVSAAIMALRAVRTPVSVLLQAAGEFRRLTGPGLWSSAVSLCCTVVLLLIAGPIAAFSGILLGEIVATERTFALARAWRRAHD